jgi:photosystem II stability/assembly factor-like uncharacterized protein
MRKSTLLSLVFIFGVFLLNAQSNWKWTQQESGVTSSLYDVFFANSTTGWAVGAGGVILNTNDGGDTWTAQNSGTDQELSSIHFIDENTGWVTGGGLSINPAPLLKTTDGGQSWQALEYGFAAYSLKDVFFIDANVGWVIKSDSIYRSADGGMTWKHEEFVPNVSGALFNKAIAATSDTTAWVAGRSNRGTGKTPGTVFDRRPHNAPNFWGTDGYNEFVEGDELQSITWASDTVGFAGGRKGALYKCELSSPGITNGPWDLNLNLEMSATIRSISFPTRNVGMFNASTQIEDVTYAIIYHTEDQGETWTSAPDSVPGMLSAKLHAPDEMHAWIVAVGGNIYKGEPDYSAVGEYPSAIDLSIYPNPTEGQITIKHLNPDARLKVEVYNPLGQIVMHNPYTDDELIHLDIPGEPGIYFVKVVSEAGEQRVMKVIKE